MLERLQHGFNKAYPKNYIFKSPFIGILVFSALSFVFMVIYQPFEVHGARSFSLEMTMAIYVIIMGVPMYGFIKLIQRIPYFSNENDWTIFKEILSIILVLFVSGIVLYFAGFLVESPSDRWNLSTFFGSCKISFFSGLLPFMFFTTLNYRYLLVSDIIRNFGQPGGSIIAEQTEQLILITSQLKKEELKFYPGQLVYVESDGNYAVFHLRIDDQIQKKMIRNSISNIELQLSDFPYFMRIHRAFIVNVKEVVSQKGNSLGYQIKLSGIEKSIPVSRQNTRDFDKLIIQYR